MFSIVYKSIIQGLPLPPNAHDRHIQRSAFRATRDTSLREACLRRYVFLKRRRHAERLISRVCFAMVAAHAMKRRSNVPRSHQAPSHGCTEKLFFSIDYKTCLVLYISLSYDELNIP